jgi:hypothetical protein
MKYFNYFIYLISLVIIVRPGSVLVSLDVKYGNLHTLDRLSVYFYF